MRIGFRVTLEPSKAGAEENTIVSDNQLFLRSAAVTPGTM